MGNCCASAREGKHKPRSPLITTEKVLEKVAASKSAGANTDHAEHVEHVHVPKHTDASARMKRKASVEVANAGKIRHETAQNRADMQKVGLLAAATGAHMQEEQAVKEMHRRASAAAAEVGKFIAEEQQFNEVKKNNASAVSMAAATGKGMQDELEHKEQRRRMSVEAAQIGKLVTDEMTAKAGQPPDDDTDDPDL